jgi:molybdopterin/thiamine biosynthesis adenylyltransferase
MSPENLIRQSDLIPSNALNTQVNVIGCGAIGSFVVMCLAKMGVRNITVYDYDRVSAENMNCQGFRFSDIGKPKVEALKDLVFDFTHLHITTINRKFTKHDKVLCSSLSGIVISAVDSMAVRKEIWETVKDNFRVQWLIDPRMAAEYALSFVMDPNDVLDQRSYEKTLYTDENSVQEPCTRKATIYCATMIAGHVVKHVKDLITGTPYARITHWAIYKNQQTTWGKNEDKENKLDT